MLPSNSICSVHKPLLPTRNEYYSFLRNKSSHSLLTKDLQDSVNQSSSSKKHCEHSCTGFGTLDRWIIHLVCICSKIPPQEKAFLRWFGKPYLIPSVPQGTLHTVVREQELLLVPVLCEGGMKYGKALHTPFPLPSNCLFMATQNLLFKELLYGN